MMMVHKHFVVNAHGSFEERIEGESLTRLFIDKWQMLSKFEDSKTWDDCCDARIINSTAAYRTSWKNSFSLGR